MQAAARDLRFSDGVKLLLACRVPDHERDALRTTDSRTSIQHSCPRTHHTSPATLCPEYISARDGSRTAQVRRAASPVNIFLLLEEIHANGFLVCFRVLASAKSSNHR